MGVETIAIGAIAASAVASTASAISAANNNSRSIQAQKDLYEQQRLDQLADYNERTGIEAQSKQLENIGVNPASVFSGGSLPSGSMPSVPSAPSVPVLENVGSAATGSLSQMVEAVGSVQGYKERSARVQKLQQEYETEKFNTNLAKANAFLTEKYGEATWYADLMDKQNSAYLKYAQGDLAGAEKLYKDMLTNIAGEEYKMKKEDALQYAQMLQLTRENLSALTDLYNARTVTEKSVRVRNFAEARQANAVAKTTEDIRADVIRYHKSLANITDTKDFVSSNTAWNDVQKSLYELNAAKLVPDQILQAIEHAKKVNDWYEVNELLGIVDEGVKAYGTYYGAKTGKGFVDAQNTRNRITEDYNQHIYNKDRQDYERRRSAIAGDGHYWGQNY